MPRLVNRAYVLTLGTTEITGLDVEFKVLKSVRREPNKATITVYNLSEESRKSLEQSRGLRVSLSAGYVDPGPFLLFRGDVRAAVTPRAILIASVRGGVDFVTTIEAEDSGTSVLQSRVSRSFPPGTTVTTVLTALIDALGIGRGNVSDFSGSGLEGAGATFPEGCTVSGSAYTELDSLVRSMGLRWSVQNGIFQLQEKGRPLQTAAVLLSPDTGLVDTPSIDNKGVVKATALLMPGLDPGRKVVLESSNISGGFEVRKVEFAGSSSGGDWYANLELKRY